MVATPPETSIVIRTYNEEAFLPALLEAIQRQQYRDYEVIVVDSGSFDGTKEIALNGDARLVEIDSRDFTFGYSLNVGIQVARGRNIAIVSAHTEPVNDRWLGNLVRPLSSPDVAMVFGRQRGVEASKFSEFRDFLRTFGSESYAVAAAELFANNANSAIQKKLWDEHPFDASLPGLEDIEWAKYWMERGYQVRYESSAAIYHIHDETWGQVHRRFEREAAAAKHIGTKSTFDIPAVIFRETGYLLGDILAAFTTARIRDSIAEIALFRFFKARGTINGLLNGDSMTNPRKREAALFDRHYKAVVVDRPGHATLKQLDIPKMKPGDVLIKVAYEGICATDVEVFEGTLSYFKDGIAKYPITPGHEFSGTIVKVGYNVADLEVGDPVVVECIQSCQECDRCRRGNFIGCAHRTEVGVMNRNGAYAEYVVTPARFAHRIPVETDLRTAALTEPAAVVLKGLGRIRPLLSDRLPTTCGVVGAGPIGHLTAQFLALEGHDVTAFDRNPLRRSYFADLAFDIRTDDDLTHLSAFELIVEATGDPDVLDTILQESSAGVTILLLGLPYARRPFSFESIVAYDKVVVGSVGSAASDFQKAITMLPHLDLRPFIQDTFALEEFEKAWNVCRAGQQLKAMLKVDGSSRLNRTETEVNAAAIG